MQHVPSPIDVLQMQVLWSNGAAMQHCGPSIGDKPTGSVP